jgi:hypothetical protein
MRLKNLAERQRFTWIDAALSGLGSRIDSAACGPKTVRPLIPAGETGS